MLAPMPHMPHTPSSSPTPESDPGLLAHIWDKPPAQVAAIIVVLAAVGGLITAVQPVWDVAKFLTVALWRRFWRPDADERHRIGQRRLFARHVVGRLQDLASKEDWRDDRFAELEAEVEVEGRERIIRWLRFSPHRDVTLRRVKSLSKGLGRTANDLIILEGDPGSGKSVALRHLAEQLALKAQKAKSSTALIPLYVNLKEFHPPSHPVSSNAVRDFIVESLTRTHDRNVDQFIDEEFDRGMRDGTWLLLLDSFDEIPEVLSSTEGDTIIAEYADAINNFLSGMRTSKAIIASREFRGPVNFRVPRFRIMALTARQQADLIKRSGLKPPAQDTVHDGLAGADPDLRQLARNPMFLGLVCEYVHNTNEFPPGSHAAFDTYLEQRLTRDADRVKQRYDVSPDVVRAVAEEIAFCMTASEGLGLSPSRSELRAALASDGRVSVRLLDKILDALEYTKLGRSADDPVGAGQPHFTFAHRRFQEYFATRVVLRMPDRVPVPELLANGRWRETAVTILQTQPSAAVAPLLAEAARLLEPMATTANRPPETPDSIGFPWPPGALHLLQLLDAGLGRVPAGLGPDLRGDCGRLLRAAWEHGHRHDRKWAVSVALTADPDTTIWLVERAFESRSVYLGGAAYTVVSRMANPPEDLYEGVRQTLLNIAATGALPAEHVTLRAQISRLPQPSSLLRVLTLLTAGRKVDLGLALLVIVAFSTLGLVPWAVDVILIALALPGFPFRYLPPRHHGGRRDVPLLVLALRAEGPLFYAGVFAIPLFNAVLTASAAHAEHATAATAADYSQKQEILAATMGSWQMIIGLTVAFYFAIWPFMIAYCCDRGCVPPIMAWPAMPVIATFHGMTELARDIASGLRSNWVRRIPWRKFLLCFAFALLIAAAAFLTAVTGFDHWVEERFQKSPSLQHFGLALLLILISGFIVFAISAAIADLYAWRKDVRLVRWLRSSGHNLGSPDILKALGSVKQTRGAQNALAVLCRIDPSQSPATLRILSDLAFLMQSEEMQLKQKRIESVPATGIGAEVRAWLVDANRKSISAILDCDQRTQDMIARTVEQTELTRHQERLTR
jgi:hypothetical protein